MYVTVRIKVGKTIILCFSISCLKWIPIIKQYLFYDITSRFKCAGTSTKVFCKELETWRKKNLYERGNNLFYMYFEIDNIPKLRTWGSGDLILL